MMDLKVIVRADRDPNKSYARVNVVGPVADRSGLEIVFVLNIRGT